MRAPDLNAPRYREKVHQVLNPGFIEDFKAKYPQYSEYSTSALIKAIKKHNGLIWKHVIDSRDGVELSSGLGLMFIGVMPEKTKSQEPVDWKKSIELGVKVHHRNLQTSGRKFRIVYSRFSANLKYKRIWCFHGVRQFARSVAQQVPPKWNSLIRVEDYALIQESFKKAEFKDKARIRNKEELKTYNSLEI